MASTTKILTSLIAVRSGRLQNEITATDKMVNVEGTSMGLCSGDRVSLEELVYGMLLPSGNDAANATALYLGGSQEGFSRLMNETAKEIGMTESHFVTPSGLDDESHYTTAFDMALLGREAVSNPVFLRICSSAKATLSYGNPPYDRTLYNHNRLLSSYDGALGIKTGFTKKSGRCLVSYALRDGVGLVAVTLNAPDDWNDHRKMLDFGFDNVKIFEIQISSYNVNVVGGKKDSVVVTGKNYSIEDTGKRVEVRYFLPEFIYAPVENGRIAGEARIYLDGKFVDSVPLTVTESVEQAEIQNKSLNDRIKELFQ